MPDYQLQGQRTRAFYDFYGQNLKGLGIESFPALNDAEAWKIATGIIESGNWSVTRLFRVEAVPLPDASGDG